MVDEFRAEYPKITSFWEGEALKQAKAPNPTGLSRAEIRLLGDAITMANEWRGQYTGHEDAAQVLAEFDARIAKMKAAVKKLKVASGYNFSGRKKK